MPSPHRIATATRLELMSILGESDDPEITHERLLRIIRDAREILENDNIRAGYTERFWARVVPQEHHMIWTGAGQDSPDGRPICEFEGKRVYAAKIAWLFHYLERVPEGMALKKTCEVPRCISHHCHIQISHVDATGRPPAVRRDAHGRPVCKRGHHLKREPKPREHVYCSACRQQDRLDIEAAERARTNVAAYARQARAPRPLPPPQLLHDAPGLDYEADLSLDDLHPQATEEDPAVAEINALFDND